MGTKIGAGLSGTRTGLILYELRRQQRKIFVNQRRLWLTDDVALQPILRSSRTRATFIHERHRFRAAHVAGLEAIRLALNDDRGLVRRRQAFENFFPQCPLGRRLTQVLINLVGNAIKFTDAGEVAIKAEANNGSFHVSVRDTGPGISAADQARLFQEFQQADNAITRKKGGTGLGLAISKRIVEMHGGKIWVESQVGHSTFSFTLPVLVEQQVNVESK
jgi:signal transduction histidine kinase